MKVSSLQLAEAIGDTSAAQRWLDQSNSEPEPTLEVEDSGDEARKLGQERLQRLSPLLEALTHSNTPLRARITVEASEEGRAVVTEFAGLLGRQAIETPPPARRDQADANPPITIAPTAGGMALGLAGGYGLGIAMQALRTTGAASGNPWLGNLAIGLGLLGTALGGAAGATGRLPKIKLPGVALGFD